jgi:hypothetical protein
MYISKYIFLFHTEEVPVSILAVTIFYPWLISSFREFPQHVQVIASAVPRHYLHCEDTNLPDIYLRVKNIRVLGYLYTSPFPTNNPLSFLYSHSRFCCSWHVQICCPFYLFIFLLLWSPARKDIPVTGVPITWIRRIRSGTSKEKIRVPVKEMESSEKKYIYTKEERKILKE